ncbi:FAD-dependent oxidoreductase [Saccharopolyspora shandongensis]|uniref:3-phenylpropionate/trans-cinnamate dioxygenase ferredoxin reductase subunit n=1 Tax=Saccharopolyspora shandongensis TaxID=418495 RepID=A0A1H3U3Q9_9PSEU|nr:FAD-dependent oxidoreductase [Saccharopolyspora shandongensis]SDZ56495.1 3-phenylpropionate/trans-cinnamate dioxygenase ferredoxin reductase subunit [Saccharopolyspora shandongensis]
MAEHGLVIIGASQAGVQLAVSLRALGYQEPITLLGEENHRPYQRPALSKEFLQGSVTKESLIYRTQEYWDSHDIDLVKNERIVRVDKGEDGSGVAHARSGATFPFGRLALTVGARARRLRVEGSDLPGVLSLRNADDALELKARVPAVSDVVVIGGGFIGLEAAASLHKMGKRVTLLEEGPRLVGRAVGQRTSEYLFEHHSERGIEILLAAQADRIVAKGDSVGGVEVDGRVIPADLVLVGVGVIPNTELAESIGLECDNGVRVDEFAVASDGVTIAVGDCANLPNPVPDAPPGDRVRFESVNNAIEQAKVAAYMITGRKEEYAGIPWFWSNQGELKLQIAGLSAGHDRTVVRHDETKGKFSVLYYRGDRVIAADCINNPLDFMAVKSALANRAAIPHDQAADPAVALKAITRVPELSTTTRNEPQ